jgi:hypothetical protein
MRVSVKARLVTGLLLLIGSNGCLFWSGPRELDKLIEQRRPTPFATERFVARAVEGEHSLTELRETLTHWTASGPDGEPRWQGVLSPHPSDLYEQILAAINSGTPEIKLVAHAYDSNGLDVLTLIDYYDDSDTHLGWDFMEYSELDTPPGGPATVGYDEMAWWEYPHLILDLPVYLAIGLKECVGEIAKSPLSTIDVGWFDPMAEGRNPLSPVCFARAGRAFIEDWHDGWTSLLWRFRARRQHTPLDLIRDLLGTAPLVGPVFDHRSPPEDNALPAPTSVMVVGQGIHSGGTDRQFTLAWEKAMREMRPELRTFTVPFRYGGVFDVMWSLFNISNGSAHDAATQIVFDHGVVPGDTIEMTGFSGSVQRFFAASRILRLAGVRVEQVVGVAAPAAGGSCAARNSLLLGTAAFKDPVILSAHATRILIPFPSNIDTIWVENAGSHHTPYFPHATTRTPQVGYESELHGLLGSDRR